MTRAIAIRGFLSLACVLTATGEAAAEPQNEAGVPTEESSPVPEPGAAPPAAASPSASQTSPVSFHLTVGILGTDADSALSFEAGLAVKRVLVAYSTWGAFGSEQRVIFRGVKAGYVHPLHRYFAAYGAAGFGELSYHRDGTYDDPAFSVGGRATVLELGLLMGPGAMPFLSVTAQAVVPMFTPGMPPGREVVAPSVMASFNVNPLFLFFLIVSEAAQGHIS